MNACRGRSAEKQNQFFQPPGKAVGHLKGEKTKQENQKDLSDRVIERQRKPFENIVIANRIASLDLKWERRQLSAVGIHVKKNETKEKGKRNLPIL